MTDWGDLYEKLDEISVTVGCLVSKVCGTTYNIIGGMRMKYLVFYDKAPDKYSMFCMLGGVFDSPEEAQNLVDELNKKYRYAFQIEVEEGKVLEEELMHYIE